VNFGGHRKIRVSWFFILNFWILMDIGLLWVLCYWFWIFGFWRIEVRCGFLGCLVFNLWVCWTKVKCGFRGLLILSLWILVDKDKLWGFLSSFCGKLVLDICFFGGKLTWTDKLKTSMGFFSFNQIYFAFGCFFSFLTKFILSRGFSPFNLIFNLWILFSFIKESTL